MSHCDSRVSTSPLKRLSIGGFSKRSGPCIRADFSAATDGHDTVLAYIFERKSVLGKHGNDRLLDRLRCFHGEARFDIAPELLAAEKAQCDEREPSLA